MKLQGKLADVSIDYKTNKKKLTFLINNNITSLEEIENVELLEIEAKKYREKRKLNCNAYLWVLLQEMADKLETSKDDLYIEMLGRYGVFTHIIVKENAVNKFMEEYRLVKDLGEITVNGTTGHQLQCYFGSSTYDSKEFSVLLNGVVNEAKELGIDTLDELELGSMYKEWGK